MKRRIIALTTVLLLASTLFSCGGASENTAETASQDSGQTTSAAESVAETELTDGLGEYDFEGQTFDIVYSADQLGSLWPYTSEAENGDVLNDAVYRRNQKVEERFNTKIVFFDKGGSSSNQINAFRESIMAGDGAYDLCINHMFAGFNSAITDGLLYDFNQLPNLDLSKPWWNQSIKENFEIDGVLLTEVSDLIYSYYDVIYFNKAIMDTYQLDYPYDKVTDGSWTWDYLGQITKGVSVDLNGDNSYDDKDQYGYLVDSNPSTMIRLIHSNGMTMATIDQDGKPTLSGMMSDKMQSVMDKYYDLVWNDNRSYYIAQDSAQKDFLTMFAGGQGMMMHTQTTKLQQLRDVTFEFGIVPLPKYDEAQDGYHTLASTQMLLLPADMKDPEFVGVVLEALSAESYLEVTPQLYDVVYQNKLLRDDESQKMFELIRGSLIYDFNWNYGAHNNMSYLFGNTIGLTDGTANTDLASFYAANYATCQKVLDDVYADIEKNYK